MHAPEGEPRPARDFRAVFAPSDHRLLACAAFWPPEPTCIAKTGTLFT
jgi:hypothetical protein